MVAAEGEKSSNFYDSSSLENVSLEQFFSIFTISTDRTLILSFMHQTLKHCNVEFGSHWLRLSAEE